MAEKTEYVIMGLNAAGRTLACLLALAEDARITLVDDGKVSDKSLDQGYLVVDLGMFKTEAVEATLREVKPRLQISRAFSLDQQLMERLASKIDGRTVLFCCEPMSLKARQHLLNSLGRNCQEIYLLGFSEEDTSGVHRVVPSSDYSDSRLEDIPEGKESGLTQGMRAAAVAFSTHVMSKYPSPAIL